MAENRKWEHKKTLDMVDNIVLCLISIGGDNLSYLSNVFNDKIPKSTLSDRIKRLHELNLVGYQDVSQKHIYRKYVLTDQGRIFAGSLNLVSNAIFLQQVMLHA